jgi:hypothetical protein
MGVTICPETFEMTAAERRARRWVLREIDRMEGGQSLAPAPCDERPNGGVSGERR